MRWYERGICAAFAIMLSLLSAGRAVAGAEITVSAALSLKPSFEEIGRLYERRYPGSAAAFNFGPSGALQKQIESGAPVDVFASASPKEMDALDKSGLIVAGSRRNFAGNSVVLITSSTDRRLSGFDGLKDSQIKRIAIGNPATVPAGKYAEETLRTIGLWDNIRPKLIYAEHVLQVMDYVSRGEVDAGMVFLTDAVSRSGDVRTVAEAPEAGHSPVVYTIAIIKGAKGEAAAGNFIALVMSKEGRDILKRYGFTVSKKAAL